jgi:hypothetical protein
MEYNKIVEALGPSRSPTTQRLVACTEVPRYCTDTKPTPKRKKRVESSGPKISSGICAKNLISRVLPHNRELFGTIFTELYSYTQYLLHFIDTLL